MDMDWTDLLWDTPFITRILSTIILIFAAVAARTIVVRKLASRQEVDATTRRRWIVTVRNITILVILSAVVVIWLEQLRTVAATVVVIAAAIVIATKEFLLNILGYIYQSTTQFTKIGDRIEIDGIRGDVIDQSMLGLTLLEIGSGDKTNQYTGLTVHVPNGRYLSAIVKNETRIWGDFVFHLITIPVDSKEGAWRRSEAALLKSAHEVCAPYLENARKYMTVVAKNQSLEAPTVDPKVQVQVAATDRINLILRIPVPTRQRARIEREVTRRYLTILEAAPTVDGI